MEQILLSNADMMDRRTLNGVIVNDKGVRDYGGAVNRKGWIMSNEDMVEAFGNVIYFLERWNFGDCSRAQLVGSVYEYKARSNCFSGDVSIVNAMSENINERLGCYDGLCPPEFPRV